MTPIEIIDKIRGIAPELSELQIIDIAKFVIEVEHKANTDTFDKCKSILTL